MNNDKANVAMVGCGYWGKNLVRNFHSIGHLSAVCDPNPETADFMSREYDVPARSWGEILQDSTINAVGLAVPAELHAEYAMAALEAGKNVYVEKPLALDVADAQKLVAKADERGLVLMVGHLLQYHPVFLALKTLVQDGKVGKLHYIYSNRLSLGKVRREENVLWSFAPHDISMVLALVGKEPTHVAASGNVMIDAVHDNTTVQLSFANGVDAHIYSSWTHPFKEQRLVVIGDKGMIVFEYSKPWEEKLAVYAHTFDQGEFETVPVRAEVEFVDVPQGEPLKNECQHFVDCILNGQTPRTDGHEGLAGLKVLDAATKALG